MADDSDETKAIENLYQYGERLNEAKDKSQHASDFQGIINATQGSIKAKQLAAQLIPRFFKYFPDLWNQAIDALFDLCEHEELGVRVQAIRGLPLLCKDTTAPVSKIIDVLAQMLIAEENVERDAVQKALMSLLRQDVKASLTALFKHVEGVDETTDENNREKVLSFIRDKVFPLKSELLKPQDQMERHVTDLIKKVLINCRNNIKLLGRVGVLRMTSNEPKAITSCFAVIWPTVSVLDNWPPPPPPSPSCLLRSRFPVKERRFRYRLAYPSRLSDLCARARLHARFSPPIDALGEMGESPLGKWGSGADVPFDVAEELGNDARQMRWRNLMWHLILSSVIVHSAGLEQQLTPFQVVLMSLLLMEITADVV